MLNEYQDKAGIMSELPRRSERFKVQTGKMIIYEKEELSKKKKRLLTLYEQWKIQTRKTRDRLKSDITDKEIAELADIIEQKRDDLLKLYSEVRHQMAPSSDVRRKIDACDAVTHDVMRIILERISSVDGEFDAERERIRLGELLKHDYALSIYGSSASSSHSLQPTASQLITKRADAAAELAAKEAEYEMAQEEQKQQERIKALEEEHKKRNNSSNIRVRALENTKGRESSSSQI